MKTARKLPRLLRLLKSYLRLQEVGVATSMDFMERSRLKGRRLQQLRTETERIIARRKARGGATLTEVLVALLIMSIGIVSIITLFPLSMMRTLKATQLTKGTDLRYNAEAFIQMNPRMLADPNGDGITNPIPEYFVIDPMGRFFVNEYLVNQTLPTAWPAIHDTFGNTANNAPLIYNFQLGRNIGGTNRYNSGRYLLPQVDSLSSSPDTWLHQYDGDATVPASMAAPNITGLTLLGLNATGWTSSFNLPPPAVPLTCRAVIDSLDGTAKQFRNIISATTDTISWSEDLDSDGALDTGEDVNGNGALDVYPLPGNFVPGRVMIQAQERRYSYLLTCRKEVGYDAASADVDVVVFADRSIDNPVEQEQLFNAQFVVGSRTMNVTYAVPGNTPNAKKGGFVFDANNARWYRIVSILDDKAGNMVIGLEGPAIKASAVDTSTTPPTQLGRVMFPKAVVDVFPIGLKQ